MAVAGIIFIALALIWNFDFPINKNLWSSSFVLNVGGISLLLLSLFYYIIDVLGYIRWSFFFRIIGTFAQPIRRIGEVEIIIAHDHIVWTIEAFAFKFIC